MNNIFYILFNHCTSITVVVPAPHTVYKFCPFQIEISSQQRDIKLIVMGQTDRLSISRKTVEQTID